MSPSSLSGEDADSQETAGWWTVGGQLCSCVAGHHVSLRAVLLQALWRLVSEPSPLSSPPGGADVSASHQGATADPPPSAGLEFPQRPKRVFWSVHQRSASFTCTRSHQRPGHASPGAALGHVTLRLLRGRGRCRPKAEVEREGAFHVHVLPCASPHQTMCRASHRSLPLAGQSESWKVGRESRSRGENSLTAKLEHLHF